MVRPTLQGLHSMLHIAVVKGVKLTVDTPLCTSIKCWVTMTCRISRAADYVS